MTLQQERPTTPLSKSDRPRSGTLRAMLRRRERLVIGTTSVVIFLSLWQLAVTAEWIDPLFVSSPAAILDAGRETYESGQLVPAALSSAKLFLIGFLISVVIAIPLGVVMGWYSRVDAVLDPFVSILYATPRIALIPLVLVWVGIGMESRVVIVVLAAVFPLLINTIAGVRATDPQLTRVARSYSATDLSLFSTVVLPGAVPYIVAGLRHAINQALIGVVVAEFFAGNVGLGAMITSAGLVLRTDIALLGVLIIAVASMLLTTALKTIENHLTRYRT